MPLFPTLSSARSALQAHQAAVRVASENISNAQTEGYSRKRVDLVALAPYRTPEGLIGSGVGVQNITRIRDAFLDASFRRDAGKSAGSQVRQELLQQVQEVLGEPSEVGLASALDAFHSSWSDLANQPTSETARQVVLQRGQQLASTLQDFGTRIDQVREHARQKVTAAVTDLNRMASQVAGLNEEIVLAEAGGQTAAGLRDQRDQLVDAMSKLGSVRVIDRSAGSIAVLVDGAMMVDGSEYNELAAVGEPPSIQIGSRTLTFAAGGSTLGELVDVLQVQIPGVDDRLDALANSVVKQVNALHRSGFAPDGSAGGDFFDPTGLTARTISVTVAAADIVASDTAGESGNNQIALAMAALRHRPAENDIAANYAAWNTVVGGVDGLAGLSFADHYRTTVTTLGVSVNQASNTASVHESLASQSELRRSGHSGVSTDEELIRVMQHQQAYAAAARLVNVVDEMMQTLLQIA